MTRIMEASPTVMERAVIARTSEPGMEASGSARRERRWPRGLGVTAAWLCGITLVIALAGGLNDERRVHMLNVYYQAPTVVTLALLLLGHNLRVWQRLRLTPSPLVCFGVEHS